MLSVSSNVYGTSVEKLQKQPAPVMDTEIFVSLPEAALYGSFYRAFRLYLCLVFAGFWAERNSML